MKTILVADDNENNRYLLDKLLTGSGFKTLLAKNGAEALETARKQKPDLIIADILMPVMDGFELCRQWKADSSLKSIPFVVYTATYTEPKDEQLMLDLGADRFIIKPQQPEAIMEIIREVLEKAGASHTAGKPLGNEMESLRRYNSVLFSKLEHKFLELETEIKERGRAEENLYRVNRALKALSKINQTLLHADNELQFMHDVCRNIIEAGGYALAWIGLAENDGNKTVRPVAQYGYEEGFLDTLDITWADTERGRGPIGTCVRTGRPVVQNDILNDPNFIPWRENALKRGYASSAGLPLTQENGKVIGVLNVYAKEPNAFDEEELGLFKELADDSAYGITMLRMKKDYSAAVNELRNNYEKLKELDRMKSNFLSIISHELRTPVTVIKGYLAFLLKGVADELTPKQKAFLGIADSNVTRLTNVINELVDVSKIKAGILNIEKQDNNIVELLNDTVKDIEYIAQQKNITIEKEFGVDFLVLNVDRNKIHQAVSNLITNAVKFSPEYSAIKIGVRKEKTGKIRLPDGHNFKCGDCAEIYVQDKGDGIEQKYLKKIFEDFFQVEDANNRKHEGVGLGLSIVKKIVDAHGGAVWAESEGLGKGAIFRIVLPCR